MGRCVFWLSLVEHWGSKLDSFCCQRHAGQSWASHSVSGLYYICSAVNGKRGRDASRDLADQEKGRCSTERCALVGMEMMAWWLDWMILVFFSSVNYSMILATLVIVS